jgi:hypothetical protein
MGIMPIPVPAPDSLTWPAGMTSREKEAYGEHHTPGWKESRDLFFTPGSSEGDQGD